MEELLRQILAELQAQGKYVRERDAALDALDEEDRQRKAQNDELMRESMELQKRGLELATKMGDKPFGQFVTPSDSGVKQ